MKVLSVIQPDQTGTARTGQLVLRPGQHLAAIVLQGAKPGGKALLSVAGGQLQVVTRNGLNKGEALDLVVKNTGQQLILARQSHDPRQAATQQLSRSLSQLLGKTEMPGAARQPASQPGQPTTDQPARPPTSADQAPATRSAARSTSEAGANRGRPMAGQGDMARLGRQELKAAPSPTSSQTSRDTTGTTAVPRQAIATSSATRPTAAESLPALLRHNLPQANRIQNQTGVQQLFRHSGLFAERSLIDTRLQPATKSGTPLPPTAAQGLTLAQGAPLAANLAAPFIDLKFLLRRAARDLTAESRTPQPSTKSTPTTASSSGSAAPQQPHTTQTSRQPPPQSSQSAQGAALTRSGHHAPVTTNQLLETLSARVDSSQIRTALHQLQGQGMWIMDMPILFNEQLQRLQMTIHEEGGGAETDAKGQWQVDIAIDLPGIGPMHASLHLTGETIDVRMYADQEPARQGLNQDIGQLQTGLQRAGLTPGQLAIYPGPPPKAVQERLTPPTPSGTQSWRV